MESLRIKIIANKLDFFNSLIKAVSCLAYCTKLSEDLEGRSIIIDLSYSKYYNASKSYLITSDEECYKVQDNFVAHLRSLDLHSKVTMKIINVTNSFSIPLGFKESFNMHSNVFSYMAQIYYKSNWNSFHESTHDFLTMSPEFISLADNSNYLNSKNQIVIYRNEYRFKPCYGYSNRFGQNMENKIWITVSRDVKENSFHLRDFERFQPYSKYYFTLKEYLLKTLFNLSTFESVQLMEIKEISQLLSKEKIKPGFTYNCFILSNLKRIRDYKVLRAAMELSLGKGKSLEKAVTTVRRILKKIELERDLIIIDTRKKFISMKSLIR